MPTFVNQLINRPPLETFKKVLLIDDDDIVNSINKVIIKHAKFAEEVVSLTTVPEAIDFLSKNDILPEIIFLDLNMPDLNGWDFMDEFSKLELQGTKVIMLTSSISLKDEQRAKATEEITAFISKPLSPELLESIYSHHLS